MVGCIGVQSHSQKKVCVKLLAWVSLPSEPEGVIVKNNATDRTSQEENANELLLIVLANIVCVSELQLIVLADNMMQTDYTWYC